MRAFSISLCWQIITILKSLRILWRILSSSEQMHLWDMELLKCLVLLKAEGIFMVKKRINLYIPKAYKVLQKVGIAKDDKVNAGYRSQIASFGAMIAMGSILSA